MRNLIPAIASVFAVLLLHQAQAQQPVGAISGTVVVESTGAPMPSATIAIRRMSDSTLVAGVLANASGRFLSEGLSLGSYRIEVASIGHAPATRNDVTLTAATPRLDLGVIRLAAVAVEVLGVTVEAERSPVVLAPDRSIYNVREMAIAQGGVATDALRAIPELEVDVDDNIRARGGEPQIYLDGRPLPMQGEARIAFLRTLRADRIDRIEYIANPSARFEADGQSGIVNIVLRRDVGLGLSGSVAANAGTRGTQNLSTRLNYQGGPLTFFGGGLLGFNQFRSNNYDFRQNLAADPVTYLQHSNSFAQDGMSGGADLTTELKLSPRSTAWAIVRGNVGDSEDNVLSEFIHFDAARSPADWYERNRERDLGNHSVSGAIGFRRVVETQRNEFSAELRYNRNENDVFTENWRHPFSLEGQRLPVSPDLTHIDADTEDGVWSFQADLSRPLGSASRIDVGYRGSSRRNTNQQGVGYFSSGAGASDSELDERFRYEEDAHAAYITLDRRLGALAIQTGVRAEQVTGEKSATPLPSTLRSRDADLFPSANLSYDFGGGRQLRFSYSKRIQRPIANNYNPLNTTPADPFNRTVGNPHLTTAQLHNVSVDASWTGQLGTLRVSPFYMQGSGFWIATRTVDAAGVATQMPENIASASVLGMGLNGSVRQIGPLSGFVNLNLQHIDFDAGGPGLVSNAFMVWQTNANITATLPHTLRLQVTGGFAPAQATPLGRSSQFRQVNFALTQRMWQNRGVITLSVVDPFDLAVTTSTTRNSSIDQTIRTSNRIRRATLTLTYNFGRPPQSSRRVIQDEPQGGGGLGGVQ